MFSQLFVFVATVVLCASAQTSTNVTIADVEQAFTTAQIVPDVLPSFNPAGLLNVVFLDNVTNTNVTVTPGLNMTREQNALRPTVLFTSNTTSFASQTFVLAMVDPDAPTPQSPSLAQIRHLLAPNITLDGSLATGALLVNNSPAISDFLRPAPPAGSDPHRYILLLFAQPANFSTAVPGILNASTPISNFNISAFAEQLSLGSPLAGNFFFTGPDANTTNSSTASSAAASATSPASSGSASGSTTNPPSSAVGMAELSWIAMTAAMGLLGMLVF